MATIRVERDLGRMVGDYVAIAATPEIKGPGIVRKNTRRGNGLAQRFAQELSGPHGKAYYKRITWEMTGAMEGEYGPHAGGVPVGGGWRHGSPNTELERSLDIVGPALGKDVDGMVDGMPWT